MIENRKIASLTPVQLIQIETFAIANGYERLLLSTSPFLDRAIHLYEKFGFRRNGEPPHDLFGTPLITIKKIIKTLDEGVSTT
jgi:hypothetical protein